MKKVFGPSIVKTDPLKSTSGEIITERAKQMERWAEHYQELYSRKTTVTDRALENTPSLPVMEELDTPPTVEELSKAIDSLANNKASGKDGIPAEIIKAGKQSCLLSHLHELLFQCGEERSVPQDMCDPNIVTLYKNKGERNDCINYRGISLLIIVGKAFARVALKKLQSLAERVYPESQCGFRAKRSTIDTIFSLRQLQEKCPEQRLPLHNAFIDLTIAFDLVSRLALFKLLQRIGCPPKLLKFITSLHEEMQGTVQFEGSSSEPFSIKSGVKQGCVLASTLFGILLSLLLGFAFKENEEGVYIHTRSHGSLFNFSRHGAKTKVRKVLIREMLFAEDAALTAHTEAGLHDPINCFSDVCNEFGVTVSIKKTNVLGQNVSPAPSISIGDNSLDAVEELTYLGSVISSSHNMDLELNGNGRIGKASSTIGRLSRRVWENTKLTTNAKIAVYQACVLSTLMYGSGC